MKKQNNNFGQAGGITPKVPKPPPLKKKIPASVVTLGWVSFFTDMASEMVYPLIQALHSSSLFDFGD